MDLYIHYTELPQGKELADIVGELNDCLLYTSRCV